MMQSKNGMKGMKTRGIIKKALNSSNMMQVKLQKIL